MSERNKTNKPELLAPAGTIDVGLAAFDCGADAVYTGLPRFNARERGRNCTQDDLSRLLAYAHKKGKRVYVTLNTLIKETELPELKDVLRELWLLRPDALIVQDLGLIRLVREALPAMELHASTQMALHNSAGVAVAERLGLKRVILERQVPFNEIEKIRRKTEMELEIFIHGALCCSRSGACLFSSWMGGWSGNRGRCKQPCRRRYHSRDGNGFFFSPGDLYALDAIPELKRLGIQSLKIEGRLKGGDYVSRVVKAYRMMLDDETGAQDVLKAARNLLSGAVGRRWSAPFKTIKEVRSVIQHRQLGASGQLCGTVVQSRPGAFDVQLSKPLQVDDRIRVQPPSGEEGPAFTVTRMMRDGRPLRAGRAKQTVEISSDRKVALHSRVFRLGRESNDMHARVSSLPMGKPVVDIALSLGLRQIKVSIPATGQSWQQAIQGQVAERRPLTAALLRSEFSRSGESSLSAGEVSVSIDGNVFFPAGELKKVRRAFWAWGDQALDPDALSAFAEARLTSVLAESKPTQLPGRRGRVVLLTHNRRSPLPNAKCSRPLTAARKGEEVWLPTFCSEGRLEGLRQQLEKAVRQRVSGLRITALYQLAFCAGTSPSVSASFAIPACNHLAVDALLSLGARRVMAWPELTEEDLAALVVERGAFLDIYAYGRLPLLSTRMAVAARGKITDSRGGGFEVMEEGELTWLYPEKPMKVAAPDGCGAVIDLTHARPDEPGTDFNRQRDWA